MIDIFLILLITAFAVYCSSESYDKNFENFFYWLERTKVPLVFINMIKIIVIPKRLPKHVLKNKKLKLDLIRNYQLKKITIISLKPKAQN